MRDWWFMERLTRDCERVVIGHTTSRNTGKTKSKVCGQMQKENRAGHIVGTRGSEDKVGFSKERQGTGVVQCKTHE